MARIFNPPPLCFDGSRSPSMHICEESVTPPPLVFDHPPQKRRASENWEDKDSEEETANTGGDSGERQHVEEEMHEAESTKAWEEEINETLTPNMETRDWATL